MKIRHLYAKDCMSHFCVGTKSEHTRNLNGTLITTRTGKKPFKASAHVRMFWLEAQKPWETSN